MSNKIIYVPNSKKKNKFFVKEERLDSDFHSGAGIVYKEELSKEGLTETHNGTKINLFDSSFTDDFKHLKRGAQIINLKDAAVILGETGITKDSIIVDAGSGSGGLSLFLGKYAKKVYSFDIREDHLEICNENKKFLGLKNVNFYNKDIFNVDEIKSVVKDKVDVITLDVSEPINAINTVKEILKIGGYFVGYTPQITQAKSIINAVEDDESFKIISVKEILHREWDLTRRKSKPLNFELGHTGFLVFIRKIC